jgi:hypothetical protein
MIIHYYPFNSKIKIIDLQDYFLTLTNKEQITNDITKNNEQNMKHSG